MMWTEPGKSRNPTPIQLTALLYLFVWVIYLAHFDDHLIYHFKVEITILLLIVGFFVFGAIGLKSYAAVAREAGKKAPARSNKSWIKSDTAKKMAGMWLVTLIMIATPYPRLRNWYPLIHNPIFLITAPLVMALLAPFILPQEW